MLNRRRSRRIEAATTAILRHSARVATTAIALVALTQIAFAACAPGQPVYFTFDTGSQSQAELIRDVLKKYDVKATFFMANEKTVKGDWSLDRSWGPYWKSLVADGHAFRTHTFDHVYFKGDAG